MAKTIDNSAEFMLAETDKLDARGIEVDKNIMGTLDLGYFALKRAADFIPSSVFESICYDDIALRGFILRTFAGFTQALINGAGEMVIDLEHIVILYNIVISDSRATLDQRNIAMGLLFLVGGLSTEEAFKRIRSASRHSVIYPERRLSTSSISWKRCNEINRRYMLTIARPAGYDHYVSWGATNLSQIAYLCSFKKMTFNKAAEVLKSGKSLWIPSISQQVENNLCSSILEGDYGYLYKNVQVTFGKIWSEGRAKSLNVASKTDLFSSYVLPTLLNFLGKVYAQFLKERDEAGLTEEDARLYLVGTNFIGLALTKKAMRSIPCVSKTNGFTRVPDTLVALDIFKGILL